MTSIIFKRPKSARAGGGRVGRLCVGYRWEDWTPVWYEPIRSEDQDEDDDEADEQRGPEVGLFRNADGEALPREPLPGQVNWFPHFDPKKFQSSTEAEKKVMQRQFLGDAWKYCAESREGMLDALERQLSKPLNRHWTSWFDEAKKWKKRGIKQRARTRRSREEQVRTAGMNPEEAEINSEDSEDSGYEEEEVVRGSMPPPPRPNGKRSASGDQSRGNGSAGKRSRGLGDFISSQRSESPRSNYMSGGNPAASRRADSRLAVGTDGYESDMLNGDGSISDDEIFDPSHPSPSPAPEGANLSATFPTPLSMPQSRFAPLREDARERPSGTRAASKGVEWNFEGLGAGGNGRLGNGRTLYSGRASSMGKILGNGARDVVTKCDDARHGRQAATRADDDDDDAILPSAADVLRARQFNGLGLTEDEALQRAIRASAPPETRRSRSVASHVPDVVILTTEIEHGEVANGKDVASGGQGA